ncbi:MAG: sigma 54-interacting transcriptional regulator, partial [Firmicutes bacterium]|nr:sigma 54-interacting transcriptional regulator [Bacillota bacterium]
HCTEVVENTRMHIVAQTGKPEIAAIQRIRGKYMIASRLPIVRDGQVVGAVGKVLFRDVSELNALVRKVSKMERELEFYRGELHKANRAKYRFTEIIGASEAMFKVKELARKAAECSSNILLLGESGTGKELFAHAIHMGSHRAAYPFIKINCAAIPNDLLEAELFGYVDGAFTGAKKGGKAGKFELAQGGTVFLDEIGDMPLQMQAKLLRVLQEREVEPIGSGRCKEIDVRIIAATNQNLEQRVEGNAFREDLYHRLNVFTFTIPPLRDRPEDIRGTVGHVLDKICGQMNKPLFELSPRALSHLESYHWPGNVRELYNVLERAVNLVETGETVRLEHLPPRITGQTREQRTIPLGEVVQKAEREAIVNALQAAGGNKTRTCELLRISRSTLYERMTKYNIVM